MKPLLVGESNPLNIDPKYALYPQPEGCSGWRLCYKVLGLSERDYLLNYDRANLLQLAYEQKWSMPAAREAANKLRANIILSGVAVGGADLPVFVLLGYHVACAFGYSNQEPFTIEVEAGRLRLVFLPHPSGLNRVWRAPEAYDRAREVMRRARAL